MELRGQVTRAGHTAHKQQSWLGAPVVDSPERQPLGLTRDGEIAGSRVERALAVPGEQAVMRVITSNVTSPKPCVIWALLPCPASSPVTASPRPFCSSHTRPRHVWTCPERIMCFQAFTCYSPCLPSVPSTACLESFYSPFKSQLKYPIPRVNHPLSWAHAEVLRAS